MSQLTYISFAFRLLIRDRIYSVTYGLAGAVFFFVFLFSIRIHFYLFGGVSLSSIVSFDQSPHFLFYTSFTALLVLFFFHCLHNLGDLGVMMAVGGNRLGCIWLFSLTLLLLFIPGLLIGIIGNLLTASPPGFGIIFELKAIFTAGLLFVFGVFLVSVPTIGINSFVDPYRAIRRQK
ncbi:ABC transporter permease [Leptospira sp. 96542]|nr:ABC transporter permease [Leptospira sp. 96542]